jgi:hypothetical protein
MMLHVQKPGLTYAASAADWVARFNRLPKEDARPLLIMWPFGPVALVYDVLDTEGEELPANVEMFPVRGVLDERTIAELIATMRAKGVTVSWFDAGDLKAGSIALKRRADDPKSSSEYEMRLNRNPSPATHFVTIADELGHLFLGHLGPDRQLRIPDRPTGDYAKCEIEAESVAFLLAARNGLESESQSYLSSFVDPMPLLDVYTVMRAAGQVEQMLGLSHSDEDRPPASERSGSRGKHPRAGSDRRRGL